MSAGKTSALDLGPRARVALAAAWIAGQGALVLTASLRGDKTFGFRMFPEASVMTIRLSRVIGAWVVAAPGGEWTARDAAGRRRRFAWRERVRDPILGALDAAVFASYGVDAQLARLQRALDDVAGHAPDDDETSRFRADVTVWKNGRAPETIVLLSRARDGR